MNEENIDKALLDFKASLAKKYTKDELVDRIIGQFESTKIAMSVLAVLCYDGSTGSARALAREQGREIVAIYNSLQSE